MEIARKVIAVIVGILVIIALVLLARWTGDQIRNRFFAPKPVVQVIPPEEPAPQPQTNTGNTQGNGGNTLGSNTATVSAVPATGPEDAIYPIFAFLFLSGAGTLAYARKIRL